MLKIDDWLIKLFFNHLDCFLIDEDISRMRDIYQKILPLDKLIKQQVGILVYKVIKGTYLLNDFLNNGDVRRQIQLRNNCRLTD